MTASPPPTFDPRRVANLPASDNLLAESAAYVQPAPQGNLALALAGAVAGAAVGGFAWFLLAYFVHIMVGYVAVLCGILAGLGAVKLGGQRGLTIGVIAAAAGVGGVIAGHYATFQASLHSDKTRTEMQEEFYAEAAESQEFQALNEDQQAEAFEEYYQYVLSQCTYMRFIQATPGDTFFTALCGLFGVFSGFRTGVGKTDRT